MSYSKVNESTLTITPRSFSEIQKDAEQLTSINPFRTPECLSESLSREIETEEENNFFKKTMEKVKWARYSKTLYTTGTHEQLSKRQQLKLRTKDFFGVTQPQQLKNKEINSTPGKIEEELPDQQQFKRNKALLRYFLRTVGFDNCWKAKKFAQAFPIMMQYALKKGFATDEDLKKLAELIYKNLKRNEYKRLFTGTLFAELKQKHSSSEIYRFARNTFQKDFFKNKIKWFIISFITQILFGQGLVWLGAIPGKENLESPTMYLIMSIPMFVSPLLVCSIALLCIDIHSLSNYMPSNKRLQVFFLSLIHFAVWLVASAITTALYFKALDIYTEEASTS